MMLMNSTTFRFKTLIVVTTATLFFYVLSVLWGFTEIYRFSLCKPDVYSCAIASEMLIHPLRGAPMVFIGLLISLAIFRSALSVMNLRHLQLLGSLYSLAMVAVYPFVYDVRRFVAEFLFPYVISLRFGDLGFILTLGTISLFVACFLTSIFVLYGSKRRLDKQA
jgi:hypothetical protein